MKTALGTVTAWVVTKTTPLLVDTCVPAGMVTLDAVFRLVNRTRPVAFVSRTFLSVELNSPVAVSGIDACWAGTTPAAGSACCAAGSARTVRSSGPSDSVRGVMTIDALGSNR